MHTEFKSTNIKYKWLALIVCSTSQLFFGSLYAFSSLSDDLKRHHLGSHIPISLMGTAGQVGTYLLGGFAAFLVSRRGAVFTCAYGTTMFVLGWLLLWIVLQQNSAHNTDSVAVSWEVAAACSFLIIGQGSVAGFLSSWDSLSESFAASQRGMVAGSLLASFSLSAALTAVLVGSLFHGDVSAFSVFMVAGGAFVGYCAVFCLHKLGHPAYAFASLDCEDGENVDGHTMDAGVNVFDNSVDSQDCLYSSEIPCDITTVSKTDDNIAILPSTQYEAFGHESSTQFFSRDPETIITADQTNHRSLVSCLKAPLLWMLYICSLITIGTSLIFVNNAANIRRAIRVVDSHAENDETETKETERFVLTFALCNCVARFLVGQLGDFLTKEHFQRFWTMLLAIISAIIGSAFAISGDATTIYGVAVALGFAEGAAFATWPVVAREWFMCSHPAAIFAVLNTSVGVGSLLFNGIAERVYIAHEASKGTCLGRACYADSFTTAIACNAFVALLSLFMIYHKRMNAALSPR